ncbi:MAG: redoxin domain-containing protein [Fimbriimonadaceae bacterium]|nr:redoxin domain-containing protein [Fimbriimonadaceae bacterium]QYK57982.1 MAG: redoxin domain-containing protein [Fimbriimonadaceae bacterium]
MPRTLWFTLPLSLLLLGAAWVMVVTARDLGIRGPNLYGEPRHPVTPGMLSDSEALEGEPAAEIDLPDDHGNRIRLSELANSGPVAIVFTKDGCPCSIESQPFFNALADVYRGRVSFIGVIDADPKVAAKYRDDFRVPYPMLSSPDEAVFRAFKSERSVYVTLVSRQNRVVKQWPGYSRSMLEELNRELARLADTTPISIDLSMAPEATTSGCRLFRPVGE